MTNKACSEEKVEWTIDQFCEARDIRRSMMRMSMFFAITLLAGGTFLMVSMLLTPKPAVVTWQPPTYTSGSQTWFTVSSSSNTFIRLGEDEKVLNLSDWDEPLSEATDLWSRAIGYKLSRPALKADAPTHCSYRAFACAELGGSAERWNIHIALENRGSAERLTSGQRRTILMHELGHLLGVPHIEDDALMDPVYNEQELQAPSINAVAIAKLHTEARK